jgi:NAD(P)-dependent dehydrogenase (short-subunit alcohol dehydrogenase family)
MKLENKVAIITGGCQGIGEAICYAYAREGAKVAVTDVQEKEKIQKVVNEISRKGGIAKTFQCDVTKKDDCQALVKNVVSEFGTVDILYHAAGIMVNRPIEDYTEEEWDKTITVNLKGSFLMSQALVPLMKEKKTGKIIFTASIAAKTAFPDAAAYCASKGGVLMLMKAISSEIAKFGVNVNCVSPGNTATPLNEHLRCDPDFVKLMESKTPTGRAYIQPNEIAGAAVFLASEDASAIHGLDLIVDDGWCTI